MAVKKIRDMLRINVSQTDHQQLELVEYLRKSGQITFQSMEAIKNYWYSYAVAANPQASNTVVEMAAIESVIALSSQINRILNHHRINRGIVLPSEFLGQCGLTWGNPQSVMSEQSTARPTSSVPQKINPLAFEQEDDIDDDIVEPEKRNNTGVRIGGLNASQSVADFLNGTNGR